MDYFFFRVELFFRADVFGEERFTALFTALDAPDFVFDFFEVAF